MFDAYKGNKNILFYIYTHRIFSLSREYYVSHIWNFLCNMTFLLKLTNDKVKYSFPALNEICTVHCLQYYNLMIGRIVMCGYKYTLSYCLQAFEYINSHKRALIKCHVNVD